MRMIAPNLVTLLALCMGLYSVRFAVEGSFKYSVMSIAAAAVFDALDGRIARALKSASRFGAELDSLADFIDFGVAPALILYYWGLHNGGNLGWFVCVIFAIACALRLARFNVMIDDPKKPAWAGQFFTGMPAPAGAIVSLLPVYLDLSAYTQISPGKAAVPYEMAFVLLVAFLMASRIPHFSGKQLGRIPREYVVVVLVAAITLILLLWHFPMEALIVIATAYILLIPLSIRKYRAYVSADRRAADSGPGPQ
ncbi:CDP-diacylglycerol--serine O-phosphatidyltransferase [Methylovirgula sp. 4M-Z18]|nr:CDP-diacylglycerol--serine O-phosphatidyltransferase [Methylovirgula sp. 4M-Z18]